MSAEVIYRIQWYRGGGARVHGRKQSSWRNHLQYIATRPEADRGDEYALRVGDDDYEIERGGAAWHVRYADERPGSTGLFGPDGPADWRDVARELEHHPLPAWRVIISMREEDAARWGMLGREKWAAAIEAAMPDVAKAMRLDPDRVRWVASYHAKPGQPHVHLVIWEEPHRSARCEGFLRPDEFRGVKRAFMRELAREERNRLAAEKTAIRGVVRELAVQELRHIMTIVREIKTTTRLGLQALDGAKPGVSPILREGSEAELARRLEALAAVMPGRGQVALAYMPPEIRAQAREIADWLLAQPGFRQSVNRYEELARWFAEHYHYTAKPEAHTEAARKARDDLRDRVAQVVLQAAAGLNRELHALDRLPLSPGARERAKADTSYRFARGAWTAGWRAVERERLRAEAAYKLAQQRELEKRSRRLEAARDQERERGRG